MNKLFNSRKVIYQNGEYIEVPDEDDVEEVLEDDDDFDPYENEEEYVEDVVDAEA